MPFPRHVSALTEGWLSERLGTDVRSFEAEPIGVGVGLLGLLYRIHLDLPRGADGPASVVAKFPIGDDATRTHVAAPLRAYHAEVGFYRDAAPDTPLSVPAVHAAEIDEVTGDFVLVLEDLSLLRSEDQLVGCSVDDARTVLSGIAAHHAHHAGQVSEAPHPWMARFDDPVRQAVVAGMAAQALPPFMERCGSLVDPRWHPFLEELPTAIPEFMSVITEPNETFAHVDLRLDNIFFGGPDRPMVLLDWQLAGIGGLAYDVAYFLSQSLATETRRVHEGGLIDGYLAELAAGGCQVDRDAFMVDYRRTLAFCIAYPVNVGGQVDLANERAHELLTGMLSRALAAIEDHDALGVWPAG